MFRQRAAGNIPAERRRVLRERIVSSCFKARQLRGQPAGQGIARGKARVIHETSELFGFKSGEVLVCDAIDPNMTFIVPLASAIVERRAGC